MSLPSPPGASASYKITFQVDQADTALSCTISGATDVSCGNSTDTVTIPPRSKIRLEVEVSANAVSRRVLFSWRAVEAAA